MIIRLKYVKRVRAKGKTYHYHRITHERLPADHEERASRVLDINRTLKGIGRKAAPGSLDEVITLYKAAPEFRCLRSKTRQDYARYLEILRDKWGSYPIADIGRKHVLALRDKYADAPSKANMVVTVLRIVAAFAVEREYRADNPAKDIRKLATGPGHTAWPLTAIERFLNSAPPMMALALKVGLYTGQREGDCLAMSWHDYDGQQIFVAQSKTGTKLWVAVHITLREALDAQQRVSPIILTTATGQPFTGPNFRHHFRKAMTDNGLNGLTFHGLRYTAAAMLAEAGCSLKEIASITGHKSLGMIEKYSRDADQRRLAGAAVLRWENASGTENGKPRS